jgi:plastocyanin
MSVAAACLVALTASACTRGGATRSPNEALVTDRVSMTDYRFTPATIFGAAGLQLTVALANKGTVVHNFSVEAIPIDIDLAPGKTRTVIFVAPATAGSVEFFCKIHRDRGMRGTIIVKPAPGGTSSSSSP